MSEFIFKFFLTFNYILHEYSQAKIVNSYHESLELYGSELWHQYKLSMDKSYDDHEEDSYRKKIWLENYNFIQNHNKLSDSEKANGFKMEANPFCDLTQDEISKTKFGLKLSIEKREQLRILNNVSQNHPKLRKSSLKTTTEFINWAEPGFVSDVKDQGSCGACWSFVTTGVIEAHQRIRTGEKKLYSEQNLIDCSVSYGNDGCDGGLMSQAFQYIIDNKGIDSESSYKYNGPIGTCKYIKDDSQVKISRYQSLPINEDILKETVAKIGPVAVGIDANHKSFLLYKSGIYEDSSCSSSDLNHAVLVVGYGTENGKDYWIIKNSWGKKWGENGFGKMARNKKNHCGIATLAGRLLYIR